jgi:hypothetical protein
VDSPGVGRLALAAVISLWLVGCSLLAMGAGTAVGQGIKSVDPKYPSAQTEKSCQTWECWDGYACVSCEDVEPSEHK